jgi:nucleotide-binding universal stress UspA family protein
MKIIMLATDGSDSASEALDFAVELCQETGAELAVVAVKPRIAAGRGGIGPAVLEIEGQEGAEHIAQAACQAAAGSGVVATPHVTHGDPSEEIAAAAVALNADLIVVGSRGLGAIAGALMGSVSRGLVRTSKIPVTVVRARSHDHAHV